MCFYVCPYTQEYAISPNLVKVHFVLTMLPQISMHAFSKTIHFCICIYYIYIYKYICIVSLFMWKHKRSIRSGNLQQCLERNRGVYIITRIHFIRFLSGDVYFLLLAAGNLRSLLKCSSFSRKETSNHCRSTDPIDRSGNNIMGKFNGHHMHKFMSSVVCVITISDRR